MTKSESIAQLADALSKAQGEMEAAKKDSANPFFKSKYADLASVWDACRAPLAKYGLSVCQMPETGENGIVVNTILMHSSGEWISSELRMRPVKDDPQGLGSAITYARRYALSAAVGIAPEDDDGNTASGKSKGSEVTEAPRVFGKPKDAAAGAVAKEGGPAVSSESVGADSKAAPTFSDIREIGDEFSTLDQQQKFAMHFRDALPVKFQPHTDQLRRVALEEEGYMVDGKGSSKAILRKDFQRVANKLIKAAHEMKEPFLGATDADLPDNI